MNKIWPNYCISIIWTSGEYRESCDRGITSCILINCMESAASSLNLSNPQIKQSKQSCQNKLGPSPSKPPACQEQFSIQSNMTKRIQVVFIYSVNIPCLNSYIMISYYKIPICQYNNFRGLQIRHKIIAPIVHLVLMYFLFQGNSVAIV